MTYEIAYGDQDLIEKLDTLPRRELVDRFEKVIIDHEPELLLLPALPDYDQDHQAVFYAAHAAARPIAKQFGNWLTPNVLAYEMTKIQWAAEPLPRFAAFTDITEQIETKLESVKPLQDDAAPDAAHPQPRVGQGAGDDPRGGDRRPLRRGLRRPTRDPLAARPPADRATLPASSVHAAGSRTSDGSRRASPPARERRTEPPLRQRPFAHAVDEVLHAARGPRAARAATAAAPARASPRAGA